MARVTFGSTCWKLTDVSLGSVAFGGYLICISGGVGWVVAPSSTEVRRNWNSINDAVTTAQASAACGDWFVPTNEQLQNPGYVCKTYWDSYASACYWSSSGGGTTALRVSLVNGSPSLSGTAFSYCVRAFRCVTY